MTAYFDEGYAAQRSGVPPKDNPYLAYGRYGSHFEWRRGWEAAMSDYRKDDDTNEIRTRRTTDPG